MNITKDRSKITIFTRQLNKLISTYKGKKLGFKYFLMPNSFSLQDLSKWKNIVKFKELCHVIIENKT